MDAAFLSLFHQMLRAPAIRMGEHPGQPNLEPVPLTAYSRTAMKAASPRKERIVVAMSGGVDSSVTAALLAREGHEVIGVTLRLYSATKVKSRACCAGDDIHDARRVAERLGIAHYVLDYEARFRERVIADFAETYARGETPIPCVRCNERVKFADLLDTARDLGASALATGHYVRRLEGPDGPELHAARDSARDQSYFLFATTRSQLDFLRFPLGAMEKGEVRSVARELGLVVAEKPDSQDICFVPDGDYARVVAREVPAAAPGEIVDEAGRVLGAHDGVIHFTVGQRKGLPAGQKAPLFVLSLDAEQRRVVVGPKAALTTGSFFVRDTNWLLPPPFMGEVAASAESASRRKGKQSSGAAPPPPCGRGLGGGAEPSLSCTVKVRSLRPPAAARVTPVASHGARVELETPDTIAPGQACVFYAGTRVLGGGWIAKGSA